ncbi:acidic mammalian chitinase [Scaptodrosophila lebanonensis]|uniref:chitinase n=1 Tax=Drosophila lebanonensis TaxID=7225 RepID=A0A6J2UJL6_DROLE|nr:acidic mammalian chitinase [Scaptodrosophila lebanonensis]
MWTKWPRNLLALTILVGVYSIVTPIEASASKHVVCYFGTWSTYRPSPGKFDVENIDPFLCTHLVYAFLGIEENGDVRIIDPYLDLEDNSGRGNIKKFNSLKLKNPTLKTLAAIGGWNEGSKKFSIVAADAEKRARFVNGVVKLIQRHGFDGIDLDWEYPGQRHSLDNKDQENFITLLKELKEGLQPFSYILSAAVGSAEFSARISYDIPKVVEYLDLINVMSYDLHGSWDEEVGINAPLYGRSNETKEQKELNVDAIAKYWIGAGAPKEKLVLGVPFYGRTFTLASADNHNLGAPHIGRGIAGPYSREPGVLGYNELCEKMQQEAWTVEWESEQQVPYAYKDRQWVGYENTRSIELKAQYVVEHNLAGVMIWSLESDDFLGKCGEGRNPLLHTINRALFGTDTPTGLTDSPKDDASDSLNTYTCTADVGFVRDPHDCSKFYYCDSGSTFRFNCPTGLSFDYASSSCNYAELVKC